MNVFLVVVLFLVFPLFFGFLGIKDGAKFHWGFLYGVFVDALLIVASFCFYLIEQVL